MQHADRQGRRQSGGHLEGLEEEAKQFTGFLLHRELISAASVIRVIL